MPTYVLLSTLTDQGRKTIKVRPGRIKQVNNEIEAMGAKVVAQYALLGPYDFVNIIEAKDNKAIAKISVELGSRGSVQFLTMPAIPIDEFIENLK
ncbi:MAG TPA: GYD domain-containing protein [Nitrospiria bacterium]